MLNNDLKYKIQYSQNGATITRDINPIVSSFILDKDNTNYKNKTTVDIDLTFKNIPARNVFDFDLIKQLEAIDILARITVLVYRREAGTYTLWKTLYFSIVDCNIDNDNCVAEVKPELYDKFTCIEDDWETDYNILDEVIKAPAYIIINPNDLDTFVCRRDYYIPFQNVGGCPEPIVVDFNGQLVFNDAALVGDAQGLPHDPYYAYNGGCNAGGYDLHPYYDNTTILATGDFFSTSFPYGGGWQPAQTIMEKYRVIRCRVTFLNEAPTPQGCRHVVVEQVWGAETVITLNDPLTNNYVSPGASYIPFKDIFQGGQQAVVWGREPFYNNQKYIMTRTENDCTAHTYELINPYLNTPAFRADIYRGRLLNDTLQMYLDKAGCGLTLKSDFLQQNINPVTGEANAFYVLNQTSDIKDPDSTEAATAMWYKFKDLLDDICAMFNLCYDIDGDDFRLEHRKFYENGFSYTTPNTSTLDLRTQVNSRTNKQEIIRSNKYEYDRDNIFKTETLTQSQFYDYDFTKLIIRYDISVNKENKENPINSNLVADVSNVISNPTEFNNDSIVITAYRNILINPQTGVSWPVVINEAGYRTNRQVTNGWLCVSNLFNRFYRHGRVKLDGFIEFDNAETFITQTNKQLQEITISDCEMVVFNHNAQVTTDLGTGNIVTGQHNAITGVTTLRIVI